MSSEREELQDKVLGVIDDVLNPEMNARFHNIDWAEYTIMQLIDTYVDNQKREAIADVANAFLVKGENPAYHDRMMGEISRAAPLMFGAIYKQAKVYEALKCAQQKEGDK